MINAVVYILIGIIVLLSGVSVYFFNYYYKTSKKFDSLTTQGNNYQSIIDQANDAMLVIDIVDGRIHQSNPSAGQLLGYAKEELEKKSLFDLHSPEYLDKSSRVVADVWEKGGLIYKDIPFLTKSGELLPVECSAKVAPFAGRPAIVIYARDIRERLKLEKEVTMQKNIIEQKNKDITDSIEYAKNIQKAILPDKAELKQVAPESFIFFKAKDIVSGDFYWFNKKGDNLLIAAADCTGHGVPGALMSMIGNSFLNEIVNEKNITRPGEILDALRDSIIKTFKKRTDGSQRKDGMDIALCSFNLKTKNLQYAGAFNCLWIIQNGQLKEVDANKYPIGNYDTGELKKFTNHEIQLQSGDGFYIYTDGYADQFGGPKGKKFKYKQMAELILQNQNKNMEEQKSALYNAHESWRGKLEQVDDILVIGVKV